MPQKRLEASGRGYAGRIVGPFRELLRRRHLHEHRVLGGKRVDADLRARARVEGLSEVEALRALAGETLSRIFPSLAMRSLRKELAKVTPEQLRELQQRLVKVLEETPTPERQRLVPPGPAPVLPFVTRAGSHEQVFDEDGVTLRAGGREERVRWSDVTTIVQDGRLGDETLRLRAAGRARPLALRFPTADPLGTRRLVQHKLAPLFERCAPHDDPPWFEIPLGSFRIRGDAIEVRGSNPALPAGRIALTSVRRALYEHQGPYRGLHLVLAPEDRWVFVRPVRNLNVLRFAAERFLTLDEHHTLADAARLRQYEYRMERHAARAAGLAALALAAYPPALVAALHAALAPTPARTVAGVTCALAIPALLGAVLAHSARRELRAARAVRFSWGDDDGPTPIPPSGPAPAGDGAPAA